MQKTFLSLACCVFFFSSSLWAQQELPPEAKLAMDALDRELQAIRQKAEEETKQVKAKHLAAMKQLQDTFTKAGKLDEALLVRNLVRNLELGYATLPAPATLDGYENKIEQVFYFDVLGATNGTAYGSNIYATCSSLATAAVHAGAVTFGERAVVKVTILPGMASYPTSFQNGVTSQNLTKWDASFRVERAIPKVVELPSNIEVLPNPGDMRGFSSQIGKVLYFQVTGSTSGRIWGTDIYTSDTSLAVAVVHAGLLAVGQKGVVKVTILKPAAQHTGSNRNGVISDSWGDYGGSYQVELVKLLKE